MSDSRVLDAGLRTVVVARGVGCQADRVDARVYVDWNDHSGSCDRFVRGQDWVVYASEIYRHDARVTRGQLDTVPISRHRPKGTLAALPIWSKLYIYRW